MFLYYWGGALLALSILNIYPSTDVLCIKRLEMYYPWFLVGFLLKNIYGKVREIVSKLNTTITTLLSVVMLAVISAIYPIANNPLFLKLIMPLGICLSIWDLSLILAKNQSKVLVKIQTLFSFYGKYSLQYYLNHLLILLPCYYAGTIIYFYSQVLSLVMIFLMAIIISTIMLFFERKIPYIKYLCGL